MHALWSCPELDVVWADQEKWGFRGEIDFTCVKELENTRPALFGIKGTRWRFRGEIDFTCVKELENTWKIHSLHCLESKEQDGGSGVILISHV